MKDLHPDLARELISEEEIARRVKQLADQISHDYQGIDRLYIIGIFEGRVDLPGRPDAPAQHPSRRRLHGAIQLWQDYQSGAVRILMDLREPIEGQHVLVVEDIVDTGHTLNYLNSYPSRAQSGFIAHLRPGAQTARARRYASRLSGLRDPRCMGGRIRPGLRGSFSYAAGCS